MKYELGDKVRINKYWKPANQEEQLKQRGIENLIQYLISDDMEGATISLNKFQEEPICETGFIVGVRNIKTRYELWHRCEDIFDTEPYTIEQESSEYTKVYLVATRMNCLRRVSFENIEFIE